MWHKNINVFQIVNLSSPSYDCELEIFSTFWETIIVCLHNLGVLKSILYASEYIQNIYKVFWMDWENSRNSHNEIQSEKPVHGADSKLQPPKYVSGVFSRYSEVTRDTTYFCKVFCR